MTAAKKIFVADAVSLVGAVSISLISNGAKSQKFYAEVTDENTPPLVALVCDDAANEKLFKDAGAAAKFITPFCEMDQVITIETDTADYLKVVPAGDPTKTLTRAIEKVTKEVVRLTAITAKLTTDIAAATALGWDTGSTAQRAKLADDTERRTLVVALKAELDAKLAALQAQVAP